MNPISRTGLFLAITALLAPAAAGAQDAGTTIPTTAQSSAPSATDLDAVSVTGRYIPAPMLSSAQVLSHISREDIEREGASTAAEALNRVPGLSVSQGKYVFVRGLNERYSQALLDGTPLPSPEPLKRVVPLDLFPTNVLDTIEVQKTYSARYPGEFGGGVINLTSAVVPDEPFLELSVGIGGNTETTHKPGLTYYGGGDSDFFGYDDGTRKVRGALGEAMATGNLIVTGPDFSAEQVRAVGRSMVNAPINVLQTKDEMHPDYSYGIDAGTTMDLGGARLGVVATAGLSNSWQTQDGLSQYGEARTGTAEVLGEQQYLSTTNQATVNGLVAANLQWDRHRVGIGTMYVHDTEKEARSSDGYSYQAGQVRRHDTTRWVERELVNTQLTGEHRFGEYDDVGIEWRAAHARAGRDSPYEREIGFFEDQDGFWRHLNNQTAFGEVNERIDSFGIDGSWRLPTERELTLRAGYAWSETERDATSRDFTFIITDTAPFYTGYQRPDYLFSDYNISQGWVELRENTGANGASAYRGGLEVDALYLEAETALTDSLRATVGVRHEDADQWVSPVDLFNGGAALPGTQLQEDYLLPALSVTWILDDNRQVRFAASQTIARPQFRELSPLQYMDLELDRLTIGNPYLVDSELTNLDVRFEQYFEDGGHFSVGAFYKDLDNPIETVVSDDVSFLRQSFVNAPAASLYGVELDYRQYFDHGLSWLGDSRMFLGANYTWSDSETESSSGDQVILYNGTRLPADLVVVDGDRMQGQSEHLANLQLGLEGSNGDQATLLVGHASERISARGTFDANGAQRQPALMHDPGTSVDLVLRKGLPAWGGADLQLTFEARNLLGEEYHEYQELGGGRIDVNRYDLGRSFSVALKASF
ncbi:TonB-dependent receptor domain-containing protein [Novilysobacter defluvii]|uniref:TonB-dependent receptor n=1 Tax=Lysobacter defluvii IMMIB APB-9 = DSM 18482 TaxID=1385515 RepID=A0A0A0M8I0_9GAMM|nr:TonB-dependent receptor [Lysobacter defluvii]KGO98519.1 TonB-dependent receptor [Lysobacter defluvii IMMIB APB-9 = DSM 18482]